MGLGRDFTNDNMYESQKQIENNELYKIDATLISDADKSWYLDCEGDKEWFPKSVCQFDEKKEELTAPLWLLKKKFPDIKW